MSIKLFTPYLKTLNKSSTVVVFPSANNQLTSLLGSTNQDFRFSKYALLQIPDILAPSNGSNNAQFNTIEGAYTNGLSTSPGSDGDNIDLMQSLQNYALNMETLMLSKLSYDITLHETVSERVFFKWLKEIGVIRYDDGVLKKSAALGDNRYVEIDQNTDTGNGDLYSKVVKFVGEVDIQGNMDTNLGSRKQVYFYVPSQAGSTPVVLFKVNEDNNYKRGLVIKQDGTTDIEYIQGSTSSDDPSQAGLSVKAFYDLDLPAGSYLYKVNGNTQHSWFYSLYSSSRVNCYFTDPDPEDLTIDTIERKLLNNTGGVTWKRPRLDSIQIDFDTASYKAFEDDATLKSFMDFNATGDGDSFDFNAMLIYYDIIVGGQTMATNLYGIMFFGQPQPVSGSGTSLKGYYKQKPEKLINQSGNGYGFILNFFVDGNNNVDFSQSTVSVNDYNTFSMQLFSEAILRMGNIMDKCEVILQNNLKSLERLNELEQLIINDDNKQSIVADLDQLRKQMVDNVPSNELGQLMSKFSDSVNSILSGKTSVDVNLIWNIVANDGLRHRYDDKNSVLYLYDDKQKYQNIIITNINTVSNQTFDDINRIKISDKNNLILHRNNGIDKEANQHIYIKLDKTSGWKSMQSVEIIMDDIINFNSYSLYVLVGVPGNFKTIGVIANPVNRFSFEVICIDETKEDYIIKM